MKNRKLCKLSALVLAAAMVFAMIPVSALAGFSGWFSSRTDAEELSAETQATAATVTQPFSSDTEGSKNFRIPAIVTLNDGTIVAAADARWDTTADGGGIDTLVAVSKDNGQSWSHNFAAYLGENQTTGKTDTINGTFIDPELATDGKTVWLLVDLFPRGLNSGSAASGLLTGTAFNEAGYLRLSKGSGSADSDYTYYLGDFEDGSAQIYDQSGNAVSGIWVDKHFNISKQGKDAGNLFYSDASYQAYPTNYLYLIQSTDGGNTWSDPQLLNMKENGEVFYGTGVGSGRVLDVNGEKTIIFPCYGSERINDKNQNLRASYIYSTDEGETWQRSWERENLKDHFENLSSELTITEVEVGETTYWYAFSRYYKNGGDCNPKGAYYVSSDFGETWEAKTDIQYSCGDAMGLITYSKYINGKPAILLSASNNEAYWNEDTSFNGTIGSDGTRYPNWHKNGRIYIYLVNEDGSLEQLDPKYINGKDEFFRYSDLTELSDGSIGLLYESADGSITFEKLSMEDICPSGNITVEDEENNSGVTVAAPGLSGVTVSKARSYGEDVIGDAIGQTVTGVVAYDIIPVTASGEYQGNATVKIPVDKEWNPERVGAFTVEDGVVKKLYEVTVEDGCAVINVEHFSIYGAYELAEDAPDNNGSSTTEPVTTVEVELTVGKTSLFTHEGKVDVTKGEDSIATVATNVTTTDGTTSYELAELGEGTFYVATSSNESNPTMQLTFEAAGAGTYYIKNSDDEYIYPNANRVVTSFNYSLGTGKTQVSVNNSSGGYQFSCYYDQGYFGTYTTNAYLNLTLSGYGNNRKWTFGATGTTTTLYLYKQVTTGGTSTTTVTFTGTGEGTTTVTVGDTECAISVTAREISETKQMTKNSSFTLPDGYTVESSEPNGYITISGTTITAGDSEGSAEVVAVKKNNGNKVTDRVTYTVTVSDVIDVTIDNSPFVGGETNVAYTNGYMASKGKTLTKLTISAGLTFDVDLDKEYEGDEVIWTIEDESVATVDKDGVVTATVVGEVGETHETYLTATVNGQTYQMPVVVRNDGDYTNDENWSKGEEFNRRGFHYYIAETTDVKVYYSAYCSAKLVEAQTGEVIYLVMQKCSYIETQNLCDELCIDFFVAPKSDEYVVTMMQNASSTTSETNGDTDSVYCYIRDENGKLDFSETAAWYASYGMGNNGSTGPTRIGAYGSEKTQAMAKAADELGCDATLGYSQGWAKGTYDDGTTFQDKNGSPYYSKSSTLSFRADRLPTVEKKVVSITKSGEVTPYTEGMTAGVGDVVTFEITVNRYECVNPVEYTNPTLKESEGFSFVDNDNTVTITDLLRGSGNTESEAASERYYVTYTIKEEDLDTTIENVVDLSYTYTTKYGHGSRNKTANASAKISIPTFETKNLIVDFGLPVSVDYEDTATHAGITFDENSVTNKNATISGKKITYTPTSTLLEQGIDKVEFKNVPKSGKEAATYSFKVIPASNVLYEENFLTLADGWTEVKATKSLGNQTAEEVGKETNVYGYDPAYASSTKENGYYAATGLNTQTMTAALTTTFTGTGFDLIGNCGPDTGRVMVFLKEKTTNARKVAIIDTRYTEGTLNQVPLAHLMVGEGGTYEVSIFASGLDGTMVNAASTVSTYSINRTSVVSVDPFEQYLEENNITDVEYIVMNDVLDASAQSVSAISTYADEETTTTLQAGAHVEIDAFRVYYSTDNESYNEAEKNVQYVNILDVVEGEITAWTENGGEYKGKVTDYEAAGGPQNEIYLAKEQSVIFGVNSGDSVQVSLRAVSGATTWNNNAITSKTEMYYKVNPVKQEDGSYTVTIANNGNNLLAIGNVKLKESTQVTLASELDDEVISYSLRTALAVEPDQPVEEEPEQPTTFVPASWDATCRSVNVLGRKLVTVSVAASNDVAYITVNGQRVNAWNNGLSWIYQPDTLRFTFTDLLKRGESKTYEIVAYNADGVASAVYTVQG